MKVDQELTLISKKISDAEVIDILKNFTQQLNNWTFIKNTQEYTKETENFYCRLFLDDDHHKAEFSISKRKENFYFIDKIIQSQCGDKPMLEYNTLLRRFEQDFKAYVSSEKCNSISIKLSKEDIGLNEIIPSQKTREYFERYLRNRAQSYHPNDIERLDYFICAASRYSKKKINSELIEQYLIEDLNWPPENAKWCSNRIDVGLKILEANKKLYLQ